MGFNSQSYKANQEQTMIYCISIQILQNLDCSVPMFTKNPQRSKLIIPDLKSRENSKGKSAKRENIEHQQYGTDLKRQLNKSQCQDADPNELIDCSNCKARLSQFVTKKPNHIIQKSTQTAHKPFLIDLIEEKVENICQSNAKLTKIVQEREDQLFEKQNQIAQIQDKFTTILLGLAQEVGSLRKQQQEWFELKKTIIADTDTPAYLKALQFDC